MLLLPSLLTGEYWEPPDTRPVYGPKTRFESIAADMWADIGRMIERRGIYERRWGDSYTDFQGKTLRIVRYNRKPWCSLCGVTIPPCDPPYYCETCRKVLDTYEPTE